LGIVLDVIIFAFLGAVLGFVIPFVAAHIYVINLKRKEGEDADTTGAGGFSFIPLATIPLGIVVGILFGLFQFLPIFGS